MNVVIVKNIVRKWIPHTDDQHVVETFTGTLLRDASFSRKGEGIFFKVLLTFWAYSLLLPNFISSASRQNQDLVAESI